MLRVVLDTNVIISGLLTVQGPAASILNLALNEYFTVLYDNRILDEYERVLKRKHFGFDEDNIFVLLNFVRQEGEYILANPTRYVFHDYSDVPFFEVAETGQADYLITGNLKDFPKQCDSFSIVNPRQFLDLTVS